MSDQVPKLTPEQEAQWRMQQHNSAINTMSDMISGRFGSGEGKFIAPNTLPDDPDSPLRGDLAAIGYRYDVSSNESVQSPEVSQALGETAQIGYESVANQEQEESKDYTGDSEPEAPLERKPLL